MVGYIFLIIFSFVFGDNYRSVFYRNVVIFVYNNVFVLYARFYGKVYFVVLDRLLVFHNLKSSYFLLKSLIAFLLTSL